jgi:thioredoxin-dependent peroxiredoxin
MGMGETVTFKGQKLTLKGAFVKPGQKAPDCELIGQELKSVKLSSFKGKPLLLISVPSLDTSVCSKETHRFNQEMEKFKDLLNFVCVSMDLPFAQSRWCAAEGAKNLVALSDYKTREFGERYGVLIEELGLLARAVFLIDPTMKVIASHLVKEVSQEPDYPQLLEEISQIVASARR